MPPHKSLILFAIIRPKFKIQRQINTAAVAFLTTKVPLKLPNIALVVLPCSLMQLSDTHVTHFKMIDTYILSKYLTKTYTSFFLNI